MSENTRQQKADEQRHSPDLSSKSDIMRTDMFDEQPDLNDRSNPHNILNMQRTLGNNATVNIVAPDKAAQRKTTDFSNLRMAGSNHDQPDIEPTSDDDMGYDFTPNQLNGLTMADPSDMGSSAVDNSMSQQTTTINRHPVADPTWHDDYTEGEDNQDFAPHSTDAITATNPSSPPNQTTNAHNTSVQRQPLSRAEQAKQRYNQRVAQPSPQTNGKVQRWSVWGAIKKGAKWVGDKVQKGAQWVFEKALKTAGVPAKMVMGFLKKAGGLFMSIVKNPGGFLKNLIGGIGQGFKLFSGNILKHLKSGFMGWLFGALSGAGIDIPSKFDMKSILTMVMQIVGITAENIKTRLAKFIGQKNVERVEKAWGMISKFMTNGIGGLWELLKDKISGLKQMVVDQIKNWVITSIIKNAVIKLASMFNPVSGLVSIINMIYNVIRFIMERGKQIASLVQAIVGAVGAIASGNITKMAKRIESALAKAIPVAIGFFSRLIGLGGISSKIRSIIMKVKKPVDKAIDKVIGGVAGRVKKMFGKDKKDSKQKGKDDSKGLNAKDKQKLAEGRGLIDKEEKKYLTKGKITKEEAQKVAAAVRQKKKIFSKLEVKDGKDSWDYEYVLQRATIEGEKKDIPEKRYLPKSFKVRRYLYEKVGNWSKRSDAFYAQSLTDIYSNLDKIVEAHNKGDQAEAQRIYDFMVGMKQLKNITLNQVIKIHTPFLGLGAPPRSAKTGIAAKMNYEVDHINSLAEHWKISGWNSDDAERRDVCTMDANLWLITRTDNRSKGSKDEFDVRHYYSQHKYVGPMFTSELAEGGKVGATTINGQPFRDKP